MEKIEHKYIEVNGIKHHVADTGSSSGSPVTILFLHGFPELWYTWRFQMIAVADAGYRAIAPDYRGYGLSETPSEPEKATFADLVSDMAAILDALDISKVFVIGQDVGGIVAYRFAICHPGRILGVVTLGIPFMSPRPVEYHKLLPEGFYITRWQEPGRAEADFGRFDAKTVLRNIYILFARSEIPIALENQEIMDIVEPSTPLPSWFTEEDLAVYGAAYEKCGFQTALQVPYREFRPKENTEQPSNIPDLKVEAPALYITGEKDYVFKFPEMENYIKSGAVKMFVPNLEIEYIPEGSHFISEQFPDKVFVIGQDFGAMVAYKFVLEYPERVLGVATLGVPFMPPGPFTSHKTLPEGFYISRWNEPGRAEADFGRLSAKTVIKNIYTMFSRNEIPIAKEGQEIMDLVEPSTPLPSWFTDDDLAAYGDLYEKSGFQTSLAVPYRSLFAPERESGKNAEDPRIEVPALYVTGEKDYLFKFPGVAEFVKSGEVKKYVTNLEMKFLPEGTHFISEQFPDEVNHHILTFLQANSRGA